MTASELAARIGKRALYLGLGGMYPEVEVKDARNSFGRTDFLVSPVAGQGKQWVSEQSLKFLL